MHVRLTAVWSTAKKMFNWDEKYPVRDMGNGKVRAAGVGMQCREAVFQT